MTIGKSRSFNIARYCISDDSDCFVIAEIGHNHQGSVDTARQMIKSAKECGADAVKLQKRDNRTLFTRAMFDMPYVNENSYGPTYGTHREALEFGRTEYLELRDYAREVDIVFFATAFDFASVDFLAELDMPVYKVASADLNNTPLLKHVAKTGKPIVISTGGGAMADVRRAYDTVKPINNQIAILQCTASYPCEAEQMNLRVISTYRDEFPDAVVGLSDHQSGIALTTVAYTLGARIVEKHFTLNRAWKGTDHSFSLEPVGLRKLVRDLRRTKVALGDGVKTPLDEEKNPLRKMGKRLVASRALTAGHCLTIDDIAIKSPNGDGLPPHELDQLVGKVVQRELAEDDAFTVENVEW